MLEKMKHIVVVGGGAAGFFGAIACAEAYSSDHPRSDAKLRITILESGRHPLSKVKISGGGRCNVTHACFDPTDLVSHYPRGHKALRGPFRQFQPQDTVAWFKRHGVILKTEADGRMFPTTDQSQTIINCLLDTASRNHITLRTHASVTKVQTTDSQATNIHQDSQNSEVQRGKKASTSTNPTKSKFKIWLKSGETIGCDRVLLATGSHPIGYRIAQSLGHTIEQPVPSLFTFTIQDPELRALAGVAIDPVRTRLILPDAKPLEQTGPLLITHWGMSGPAALKLSAWGARGLHACNYKGTLQVTWLPSETQESLRERLLTVKQDWPKKAIASISPVNLPRRFWRYLLTRSRLDPKLRWADTPKKGLNRLVQSLIQDDYPIKSKGVFKDEFVTCGGVRLKEVNFKTMESRCCPELFLAGELLDIDGVTGGFNFQNAWTTGWIAGQALAQ